MHPQTAALPSNPNGFWRARLSREGVFGLHLTLGVAVFLIAAVVFGNIAEDLVTKDRMVAMDLAVSNWFYAHATPALTQFFLALSNLHGTLGVLLFCLVFGAGLARRRAWDWLLLLLLSVPIGMVLNVLLKNIFQRARPTFDHPLITLVSYSFPSGHTAAATLLYSVLGAWLLTWVRGGRRWLVVLAGVTMVALVALSRVYLGVHYLSDVVAAVASSTCWLAVTFTSVAVWRRRTARTRRLT
jgi:membrane-associated phospholipid phosphatase